MRSATVTLGIFLAAVSITRLHSQDLPVQFVDGNKLLRWCVGENVNERNLCLGYLMAVIDDVPTYNTALKSLCVRVPKGIDSLQVRDIVVKFLRDYPKIRHQTASMNAIMALHDAWGC